MASYILPAALQVSRREIANNLWTWRATGAMYAFFGTAAVLIQLFAPDLARDGVWWFPVICGVVAIVVLASKPTAVDGLPNHVVLALTYITTAAAFVVFQPGGAIAIAAGLFIGPLTASRLQNRWHIGAHMWVATVLLFGVVVFGGVDVPTKLSILLMIPAHWILAIACTVVLEGAEQQGDELALLTQLDPLTGAGNRRLLDAQLPALLDQHRYSGSTLSVLALDLNGFKPINDEAGHAAGDALLRDVSALLQRLARSGGMVVRQGGDEFCVVLPETTADEAGQIDASIREGLTTIVVEGRRVTTAIGHAAFPADADNAQGLLDIADSRLRTEKNSTPRPRRGDPGGGERRRASDSGEPAS